MTVSATPTQAPLPVLSTAADAYRLLLRHAWRYALHILLATILIAVVQTTVMRATIDLAPTLDWRALGAAIATTQQSVSFIIFALCGVLLVDSWQRTFVLAQKADLLGVLALTRGRARRLRSILLAWCGLFAPPAVIGLLGSPALALYYQWPLLVPAALWPLLEWVWIIAMLPLIGMVWPLAAIERTGGSWTAARTLGRGQRLRIAAAAALALGAPAAVSMALSQGHLLMIQSLQGPPNSDFFVIVGILYVLDVAWYVVMICIMAALLAAAFMRISPSYATIYAIFD